MAGSRTEQGFTLVEVLVALGIFSIAAMSLAHLGNETLVFAEFAGEDWIARMLNPKALHTGDKIDLSFDLSQAHLFDAATEQTLRS